MHFLYDLGHPAHVHLFRNVARQLIARGHQVTIAIRDRDIVATLLDRYGLPYVVASKARRGRLGALLELIIHDWNIFKLAWRNRVDCLAGTSVSASHVGWILRKPSFVLNEDDADYVKRFALLAYPLASRIVIPDVLRDQRTGKTRTHRSYHELAYLHPSNFKPNPGIRARLGLQDGERFFILRLVSFRAHHDIGHTGLSNSTRGAIDKLAH